MRILISSFPFAGHTLPLLPIAKELVRRGHEVRWYSGTKYRTLIEATGAGFEPFVEARNLDEADLNADFPGRVRLSGFRQIKYDVSNVFVAQIKPQFHDLERIARRWPFEVILTEQMVFAAILFSEQGGPPCALLNVMPLGIRSRDTAPFGVGLLPSATPLGRVRNVALHWMVEHILFGSVSREIADACQAVGRRRRPFSPSITPHLMLQPTIPAFEYPASDHPRQLHFIGPLVPETAEPPALPWWPELAADKPVILVTQGTITTQADQLIVPTLQGLAQEDLLVIVPGVKDMTRLGELPSNARVERYIPYSALLPHVDVFVTNGGYGGVQQALAHGVPIVIAGKTEDKIEVANRIQQAGVGVKLATHRPTPDQVRAAVTGLLGDNPYRRRAEEMGRELRRHDAPREAASFIEQLAATQQPVYRGMGGGQEVTT